MVIHARVASEHGARIVLGVGIRSGAAVLEGLGAGGGHQAWPIHILAALPWGASQPVGRLAEARDIFDVAHDGLAVVSSSSCRGRYLHAHVVRILQCMPSKEQIIVEPVTTSGKDRAQS